MAEAPETQHQLTGILDGLGFSVKAVSSAEEGFEQIKRGHFGAAIVEASLPGTWTSELLRRLRFITDHIPVIVLSADTTPRHIIESMREGAIDFLGKPVIARDLERAIRQALETAGDSSNGWLLPPLPEEWGPHLALWVSPKMRGVRKMVEQVANPQVTVLIRGETGVGKDVVARAIHYASRRRGEAFVKVNCAALPPDLLESELFGHEKGAFTGAYRRKPGKFELANKGTLLLDEIGELPLALQAKLLHVIEDHEFSRLGGREMIRADVRILASTNRNLEIALSTGQFREDLYYRLNVMEIHVPPLRERKEEIPVLVTYFLNRFNQQYKREVGLPPETVALCVEYAWPGNVRELENIIRRLVVLGNASQIHEEILSRIRTYQAKPSEQNHAEASVAIRAPGPETSLGLREIARHAAREAEHKALREILDRVHWNRAAAARLLKISYKTLLHKIDKCGLNPKETRPQP